MKIKNRSWIFEAILCLAVLALILVLKAALLRDTFILVCFFVFAFSFVLFFFLKAWLLKRHAFLTTLLVAAFISASMLIYDAEEYSFVGGDLTFWVPSLAIAAVIGVIVTTIVYRFFYDPSESEQNPKKKKKEKNGSKVMTIAVSFFVACLFSFLIAEATAEHLNYLLRDDEPEAVSAEILDKDHRRRSKGRDYYEFTLVIDGEEIELDVPSSVYDAYAVGDTYTFQSYDGGLGEEPKTLG